MTSLVETLKWEKSLSTIFKLYNIKEYVYNFQSYTGSETKMYLNEVCIMAIFSRVWLKLSNVEISMLKKSNEVLKVALAVRN